MRGQFNFEYVPICSLCSDKGFIKKSQGTVEFKEVCSKCNVRYRQRREDYKTELKRAYHIMK